MHDDDNDHNNHDGNDNIIIIKKNKWRYDTNDGDEMLQS